MGVCCFVCVFWFCLWCLVVGGFCGLFGCTCLVCGLLVGGLIGVRLFVVLVVLWCVFGLVV